MANDRSFIEGVVALSSENKAIASLYPEIERRQHTKVLQIPQYVMKMTEMIWYLP
jgi:hypothetical protein